MGGYKLVCVCVIQIPVSFNTGSGPVWIRPNHKDTNTPPNALPKPTNWFDPPATNLIFRGQLWFKNETKLYR